MAENMFGSVTRGWLLVVVFMMLTNNFFGTPSFAVDYAQPEFKAWQSSREGHLVIEWPEIARVQQKRVDDRLILRFARPITSEISSAIGSLSDFVDQQRTTVNGRDLSLVLRKDVLSKVKIRERRIVSVTFARNPASPPSSRIDLSPIDNGVRLALDWPGPTTIKTVQNSNKLQLRIYPARDLAPSELADLQQRLLPWFRGLSAHKDQHGTTLSMALEPQVASSVRSEGQTRTVIDLIRDASALPAPAAGPVWESAIPKQGLKQSTAARPPIPEKRPDLHGSALAQAAVFEENTAADSNGTARTEALILDWGKPVALAIFIRAGYLWVVTDDAEAVPLDPLPPSPPTLGPGAFIQAEGGSALRFPLKEPIEISANRTEDGRWRIEPGGSASPERAAIVERTANSSALRIKPVTGKNIVKIIDPSVGDRIDVLPLIDPGIGLQAQRRFVDVELLQTVQGFAWRPLNDRLLASIDDDSLTFSSPQGLALSSSVDDLPPKPTRRIIKAMARKEQKSDGEGEQAPKAPAEPTTSTTAATDDRQATDPPEPSSYFDLADSGVDRALVGEYRRIRRQAIRKAGPEERDQAKLDLARLLVSERLATEARTVLNTVSDDAGNVISLQKQALRGVSAFLIGHLAEASDLLLDPGLGEDEEIGVWRAALESTEDRWKNAADGWRAAGDMLDLYPPRLKLDLGLMALQAAIETDDEEMMDQGVERLAALPLNAYEQARVEAMTALRAERRGDLDEARKVLRDLTDSPHPAIRSLADFQLMSLNLAAGEDQPETLASLERRLPVWRGHPNEKAMLDELARRFRDADALRRALTLWRRLIRLFPEAAEDQELKAMRQETFLQALTSPYGSAVSALDVYAIYLDFIDLMPDDAEARTIHTNLARHLSDLDLLEEAIDVLRLLMTTSNDPAERASLAVDIATLMLRQDRPAPALSVLDGNQSASDRLPPSLEEQRRSTRALALASLGRADDALRELRDLQSQPVRRLRAEILWKERRWPRLATTIESYLANVDKESMLTVAEQELVLWLAMARQRDANTDQSTALRERFGEAMQDGPYAEAFDLATQHPLGSDDIDDFLNETDRQLAEIQRFRRAAPSSP